MATTASGITVSGIVSASEVVSVTINEGGERGLEYSGTFNPNAGTATIVALDAGGNVGDAGKLIMSNGPTVYGRVESSEISAEVNGLIRYTTTVQLMTQ